MILGVLASVSSIAAFYFGYFILKNLTTPLYTSILMSLISSATGFFVFAKYPFLWDRSNVAKEWDQKVAGAMANILSCIQLVTFVTFVYLRSIPIIKISNENMINRLKYLVILDDFLLMTAAIVRSIGRFYSESLTKVGSMAYLAAGVLIIFLDLFYLSMYRQHQQVIRISRSLYLITVYSEIAIFLSFVTLLSYIATVIDNMALSVYYMTTLIVETSKWAVIISLFIMKVMIHKDQMQNSFAGENASSHVLTNVATTSKNKI